MKSCLSQQKSAPIIRKLVESAVANAEVKNAGGADIDVDDLFVETITVDAGQASDVSDHVLAAGQQKF